MKKTILLISTVALLLMISASINAAPVIFGVGNEKIIKVADFPNTEEFKTVGSKYVDAGYIYKQVHIFYIPVWNYGGRWTGYVGNDKNYLELTKAELDELAKEANVKLPETPSLSLWETIGGKLVFGLILILYLAWKFVLRRIDNQGEDTDGESLENTGSVLGIQQTEKTQAVQK